MQQIFRKYCSLLLLFLFLFPQIEKGIHDWHHQQDEHCTVKDETHFHKEQHSCVLCDYEAPVSNEVIETFITVHLTVNSTYYVPYSEQGTHLTPAYQLPPRAPPVV